MIYAILIIIIIVQGSVVQSLIHDLDNKQIELNQMESKMYSALSRLEYIDGKHNS